MAEETGVNALRTAIGEDPPPVKPDEGTPLVGTSPILSNEELLARLNDGQEEPEAGQVAGAGAGASAKGGQGDPRAEFERMKAELEALKDKAALVDYIESNPSLRQAVSDSIAGRRYTGASPPPASVRTLEEELGLPSNFVPDSSEFFTPGTDSYRWFQANVRKEARQEALELVEQMRTEAEVTSQAAMAKKDFYAAGRTEEDLQDLMSWTTDPKNFSLERLWLYRQLAQRLESGDGQDTARANRGTPSADRHVASVAGVAGGSPQLDLPESTKIRKAMLEIAAKNQNPFERR